jgi:hypothetical protein
MRRVGLLALVAGCGGASEGSAGGSSREDLVARFVRAHGKGDIEGMMNLVCWDGVTPEYRTKTREQFEKLKGMKLRGPRIDPPEQGQLTHYTREGVTYRLNLELGGNLRIEDETITMLFPAGQKGGRWYLSIMAPK